MEDVVIRKVKEFIKEQGLEIKEVNQGEDGYVTIKTSTSNIRSIGMKAYLNFIGNKEHTVGYDSLTFYPSADLYSFSNQVISEDPHTKPEDVRDNIHDVLKKYVEKEEIEVTQNESGNFDGACLFDFTVTSSYRNGSMAEAAYLNYAIPSHKGKSKELLSFFIQNLQKEDHFVQPLHSDSDDLDE